MSGGGRSQAETIAERRLRHVYDNLDCGWNKKAVQEAEKVLKKHPDTLGAKSLKALALIRLGRESDANTLIDQVLAAGPREDHVLTAITHCFKDLGRPERIAALYAAAVEREPGNVELMSQLFLAQLRQRDFRLQQQTAVQLAKLCPASPLYKLWAAVSVLLQGDAAPDLGAKMFYPMAEKLMWKLASEAPGREADLPVFLLVLERQGKWAAALDLLQAGPSGKVAENLWDRDYKILNYLSRLEKWDDILTLAEQHIPKKPDDWRMYEFLLDATLGSVEAEPGRQKELVSRASELVLGEVGKEKAKAAGRNRGPYLARLALIQRLLERELVVRAQLGEPLELLLGFFGAFGEKPSAFADLRGFLCLLGEQQQGDFLQRVWTQAGFPRKDGHVHSEVLPQSRGEMWRHLCCVQLSAGLGELAPLKGAAKVHLATHLVALYRDGKNLQPTLCSSEMRVGDGYLILAAHIVWELYLEQADTSLLLGLVVELELGLADSPVNFNFKLALLKLYSALGGLTLVLRMAESLDLKYIQLESLGYLVEDQLSPFGGLAELLSWLRRRERWWESSEKELADCVASAFRSGKLGGVPDILAFRRDLEDSAARRASAVAAAFFTLLTEPTNLAELATIDVAPLGVGLDEELSLTGLRDNRDLDVFPSLPSPTAVDRLAAHKDASLQESLDQCRLREMLLRCFALTLAQGRGDVVPEPPVSCRLKSILTQLRAHHRHCRESGRQAPKPPLEGVMSSGWGVWVEGGYLDLLLGVLESVVGLAEAPAASENGHSEPPPSPDFQDLLRRMVSGHQVGSTGGSASPVPSPHFPVLQLVHLSLACQTLGVALLLATSAVPLLPAKRKRKEKGAGGGRAEELRGLAEALGAGPPVLARLVGDLATINDSDMPTLNVNAQPFFLRPVEKGSDVWVRLKSVRAELRSSYAGSLEQLTSFVTHLQRLADNLHKAVA